MYQYLSHSLKVLSDKNTVYKPNRTGVDSVSRFGHQNEYDLSEGFPISTTKKIPFKQVVHELLWFLRGDTNIKYLVNNGVHIWDDNAFQHFLIRQGRMDIKPYTQEWIDGKGEFIERIKVDDGFSKFNGTLGDVYGKQWRKWRNYEGGQIDQIKKTIESLRNFPNSRRHIVSAWNVAEVDSMALPPCHSLFQFNVSDGKLDCQLYQRSCDMFLGVPFNIASYALLTHIVAQQTGLKPGSFIHTFGDAHFYCGRGKRGEWYSKNLQALKLMLGECSKDSDFLELTKFIEGSAPVEEPLENGLDHVTGILEQMARMPRKLPKVKINNKDLEELTVEDFELIDYEPHPHIRRMMAV